MNTPLSIGFKRVKKNFRSTAFSTFSILISAFIISFFTVIISVFSKLGDRLSKDLSGVTSSDRINGILSVSEFTRQIFQYLTVALIAIIVITVFTIYVYLCLRADENKKFYATLESIGATAKQRTVVMIAEISTLYLFPILIGLTLGAVFGNLLSSALSKAIYPDFSSEEHSLITASLIFLAFVLLLALFVMLTNAKKRKSTIESLRLYNRDEADKSHGYRNSNTFRSMCIEKRIAKKSVEYYKRSYRRISIMISGAGSYLALAFAFFTTLSRIRVALDDNPYDNIDTTALSTHIVTVLTYLTPLSLIILFLLASGQIVMMIKAQNKVRSASMHSYRSVGMTEAGVKKVLKYEYGTVVFHALIYTIFASVTIVFLLGASL